ncbi:MAG TPA: LysE family translocator [Gammaproteobacteria bacterium]|jgi:threonine/homoserine/homoserine lactone efflux protein
MLGIHDYWLFVLTGVLLNLAPGQDTFYIVGRSLAQGTRAGIVSALGINAGSVVHTFAAAVGLSAILAASASAFTTLKLIGAAYLVYLGVRMLATRSSASGPTAILPAQSSWTAFHQGMLTNLLNPKVALFFLAFMPQFIDVQSTTKVLAFLALGATFVFTGTTWCLILALASGKMRESFVRQPGRTALISRVAGGVFVLLGLRLALSRP